MNYQRVILIYEAWELYGGLRKKFLDDAKTFRFRTALRDLKLLSKARRRWKRRVGILNVYIVKDRDVGR